MKKYETIGIDLGEKYIKMAHVKTTKATINIKSVNYFTVDESLDAKEYAKYLKKCLKAFLKVNNIKFAILSFTIPANNKIANISFLEMPVLKKKLIKKNVNYEIESKEEIGNINDIYTKWTIVDASGEENMNRIMILSIRKEIIAELSTIAGIELKIDNIELQPITLGRGVTDDSMIIDFGHNETRIYVYKNKTLFLSSTIDFCGATINQMIRDEFDEELTEEEIDRIKFQLYIGESPYEEGSSENSLINAIESVSRRINVKIIEVKEEIKRTLRALELQFELYINDVRLTGGLSNITGLKDFLSYELGVEAKDLNFFTLTDDSQMVQSEFNVFYSAVSASLYKHIPYMKDVNFGKLIGSQIDYSSITILILCASIITHVAMFKAHGKYDQRLGGLNEKIAIQTSQISQNQENINEFKNEIEGASSFIAKIEGLSNQNKWLSDVLYALSEDTPDEIIIYDLDLKDGKLVIKGYSKDYSDIGFIAMGLEKHGQVNIDSIENTIPNEIYTNKAKKMTKEFKITLTYSGRMLDDVEIDKIESSVKREDSEKTIENIEKIIDKEEKNKDK